LKPWKGILGAVHDDAGDVVLEKKLGLAAETEKRVVGKHLLMKVKLMLPFSKIVTARMVY
jgi:hypothetical protein